MLRNKRSPPSEEPLAISPEAGNPAPTADRLYDEGRYEEAVKAYTAMLESQPHQIPILQRKAEALLALGQHEAALECYDRIVEIDPHDPRIVAQKADLLAVLGRAEEAVANFDRALALNAKDPELWLRKGSALRLIGLQKEARDCYAEALALDPENASAWRGEGDVMLAMGEYRAALESYERCEAIDPHTFGPHDWARKGDALSRSRAVEEALLCYDRALAGDPQHFLAWRGKASALVMANRAEEALSCLGTAVALTGISPADQAIAWLDKGNINSDFRSDYKNAMACYEQAMSLDPKNVFAWSNRAVALLNLEDFPAALASVNTSLEIDPNHDFAWFVKGRCLEQLNQLREALACYDKALALKPDHSAAWTAKARVLSTQGHYSEALALFDKSLQQNGKDYWALFGKSLTLREMGKYDEAEQCLRAAIGSDASDRDKPAALNALGVLLSEYRGKNDEALTYFQKAYELQPEPNILANIAECQIKLGRYERGRADAREAQRNTADHRLQCICSFLILSSHVLDGNRQEASSEFAVFLQRLTDLVADDGISTLRWNYRGLSETVTHALSTPPESRFLLLTLMNLQSQPIQGTDLALLQSLSASQLDNAGAGVS